MPSRKMRTAIYFFMGWMLRFGQNGPPELFIHLWWVLCSVELRVLPNCAISELFIYLIHGTSGFGHMGYHALSQALSDFKLGVL